MTSTSPAPAPIRSTRSPSPSLPPPPQSAKLPPKPTAAATSHVAYSRQSLGPSSAYLSAGGAAGSGGAASSTAGLGGNGTNRIVSGPAGMSSRNGGRPSSEILGMGSGLLNAGGHLGNGTLGGIGALDARSPEAEAIDRWFQDLASYEVTLEEMAAASQDQNFTEELGAIEQWFRVLSEAERTAALYSLLQHSTGVQIRFFMTVLQQMARSDPMSALLSPAVGAGNSMQAQMEAKLAGLGMKSPGKASFGPPGSPNRDSFGGGVDPSSFLSPEAALSNAGEGPQASASSAINNRSKRTSAPGGLSSSNSLSPNNWNSSGGQLDQVLERGGSPFNESERSHSRLSDGRPKSTDFSGNANTNFTKSPRLGSNNNGNDEIISFPLSPAGNGNWASMVNTPAMPMFPSHSHTSLDGHPAFSTANLSTGPTVLLSEAPKRRVSGSTRTGPNQHYNDDGEAIDSRRVPTTPGSVGGGFQGANGTWSRSPNMASDSFSNSNNSLTTSPFPTFGLGVGIGGLGAMGAIGSPSANDIALQMSQLQLQQLQLQQLQQLQQLGVGGGMMGMGGMGLGMGMNNGFAGLNGMGLGLPGNMQMGSSPRNGSGRSTGTVGGAGRRSPMVGGNGFPNKSPAKKADDDEETDIKVLEDIPAWLRALRLHKYTPNFEGSKWRDMVVMSDADLEAKGVAALGARRKLLKTFEAVRNQYGIPAPYDSSTEDGTGPLAQSGDEES